MTIVCGRVAASFSSSNRRRSIGLGPGGQTWPTNGEGREKAAAEDQQIKIRVAEQHSL